MIRKSLSVVRCHGGNHAAKKSEKNELAGRRVLIVEDEYFLADDFRQILADYGAEVLGPVATLGVELGALIVAHEAPVGDQLS